MSLVSRRCSFGCSLSLDGGASSLDIIKEASRPRIIGRDAIVEPVEYQSSRRTTNHNMMMMMMTKEEGPRKRHGQEGTWRLA